MRKFIVSLAAVAAMAFGAASSANAAGGVHAPQEKWSWTGFFGSFDKASAQRGFQVYQEVCSACHGLDLVAYRNLDALGYNEAEIKAIAAEATMIAGPNDEGEMFERPGVPADRFANPFENENAARAANDGAYPPDFSLLVKARATGHGNIPYNFTQWMAGRGTASGADYVYALLTGYDDTQAVAEGKYWNAYFPGHAISMAPPLSEDAVEYADGTPATVEQMSRDISTFLAWASEPELEQRKSMGLMVILFLVVLLGLSIAAKRRRWANVKK
ncbi:cytochrome c1 [Curvivirga sp.]|uniref:cytochrome c1 n=1 Tax=Curvivirga sp. TaxID=2856848 RepID=UPI003B5910BF